MLLTEEEKWAKGIALIEHFFIDDDIKKVINEHKGELPTKKDFVVVEKLINYIDNHYHDLTLVESSWQVTSNQYINENLYISIYESLLTENPLLLGLARIIGGAARTVGTASLNAAKSVGNDIPGFLQKSGAAIKNTVGKVPYKDTLVKAAIYHKAFGKDQNTVVNNYAADTQVPQNYPQNNDYAENLKRKNEEELNNLKNKNNQQPNS